ncbi:16S rRNA (uracil(1498)-N(3))-methyltransferase [soil metagenome]
MADRFYCPEPIVAGLVRLTGDEAHHLARVRRLGPGDRVELFDGLGRTYRAQVAEVGRDRVALRIEGEPQLEPPTAVELTLATAVPKGDRFDWLIEKATELGVDRLIPLRTERSVVDPRSAKLDRLRRRIVEACKQSGRSRLMALGDPIDWADLFVSPELPEARWIAHPAATGDPWGIEAAPGPTPMGRVIVAIGPEGGFSEGEVAQANAQGWRRLGLGPTILRVETAALAACVLTQALRLAAPREGQAVH